VVIVALGLAFLYGLFTVGSPFLLALLFAIFLEPLNGLLMRYAKLNRLVAATISCTLFVIFTLVVIYLLLARIFSEFISLLRTLNFNELYNFVNEALKRLEDFTATMSPEVATNIQNYAFSQIDSLQGMTSQISGFTLSMLGKLPGLLIYFLVFFVALYLFSYSMSTIKHSFLSFFEERSRDKVETVLLKFRGAVFGFFRAQAILSTFTFVLALTGLFILDVRYAVAIAFFIVIVDVLPVLGTGSVLVPWATYMIIMDEIRLAIGLLIMFVVITVFRRIIEPKILGEQMGIAALPTLISLYVGFELIGAIGLVLGPCVVIIYQAMVKVGLLNLKIRLE
jgi:sporulation integral membrane protein YtvI